jgi:hypothetical protein
VTAVPFDPEAWLGMPGRERRELRNDAIRHAVYLHTDGGGDAMVVLERAQAASDVIATAEDFYRWVVAEEVKQ